jgi:hypothetical protein
VSTLFTLLAQHTTALWVLVALAAGGGATAGALRWYRFRAGAQDTALWVMVANMNTLLRLDLDHLSGDDDNFALRESRSDLKRMAAHRTAAERKLLDHYNGLVGVAIAFGERVHTEHGIIDMQAVANRRTHVQNALAVGDQIEAALGGLAELARCGNVDRRERNRLNYQRPEAVPAPAPVAEVV